MGDFLGWGRVRSPPRRGDRRGENSSPSSASCCGALLLESGARVVELLGGCSYCAGEVLADGISACICSMSGNRFCMWPPSNMRRDNSHSRSCSPSKAIHTHGHTGERAFTLTSMLARTLTIIHIASWHHTYVCAIMRTVVRTVHADSSCGRFKWTICGRVVNP